MEPFVPTEITELLAALEAKQDAAFGKKKLAEDAERARQARIMKLRVAREPQLMAANKAIADWLDRFRETIAPALFRFEPRIVVFSAKFWNGEPAPPDDRTTSAQLVVKDTAKRDGNRTSIAPLAYEEVHKGQVSVSIPIILPMYLWSSVHPDFTMQCAAQLSGSEAWKPVRALLERLNGR